MPHLLDTRSRTDAVLAAACAASDTSGRTDELDVDLVLAVVEGLATACCAPGNPLSTDRAAAVLTRLLESLDPGAAQRDRCRARAKQNSP